MAGPKKKAKRANAGVVKIALDLARMLNEMRSARPDGSAESVADVFERYRDQVEADYLALMEERRQAALKRIEARRKGKG